MATESPLWPTDINKHFSWPAPWSHEASDPQRRARDSPSPRRMSPPLTPERHPHLFSFLPFGFFSLVLPCCLNSRINENSKREREKDGDRSQRAACLLWVGNDIMRGLQCLVGGSFYSNCQDKCAIIHFDWVSVCACMYMCTTARCACDGKRTRGILRWAKERRREWGRARREGRESRRKGCDGKKEKGKRQTERCHWGEKKKKMEPGIEQSRRSAGGDGWVKLRSNKVQNQ